MEAFINQYIRGTKIITPHRKGTVAICRLGKSALPGKLGEKLSGDKHAPTIICGVYCVISLMGQVFNV
ncbi:hypothetical protein AFLA70_7g007181 [Aspergillus flavus AF70]|nr:hypothetical protein AFLA70_7g007181 [Aspergillus flavus AF70]